jgi:hypothetical protein
MEVDKHRLSPNRILERIGGGRMWWSTKAEDTRLHGFVGLKFLPDDVARDLPYQSAADLETDLKRQKRD